MSPTTVERDRDPVTWLGLAVVGAAAAVLSFSALSDLARMVGIDDALEVHGWTFRLAWLLPLTVDVLAAVATRVWLRRRAALEAVIFARRAAWSAIAATVGGNAYHGALVESGVEPPLLASVVVGAVPAVVLGALVHLAVLVGRPPGEAGEPRAATVGLVGRLRGFASAAPSSVAGLVRRRSARQADGGGDQADRVPTRADSDDAIAADLRRLNSARQADGGKPLSRDAVVKRYGVGSDRAQAIRDLAAQPPGRPHLVGEEATAS